MADDPFAQKVFLQTLDDPLLTARYSSGHRRRAGQLQAFVKSLHQTAEPYLGLGGKLELLVIKQQDWRQLFSYPYGWPFTRNKPAAAGVSIIAAADYPLRFLHRWDDIFVRAAKAGHGPPGDLREFLDLLIGHEWGHAAANLSGLRSRVKWFDELMASYLFLAALKELEAEVLYARFLDWAELEIAGSTVSRIDLGAFEYPLSRLRFENLLWFQAVFTLRAAEMLTKWSWDFPKALAEKLDQANRGDVARALVEIEPSFKDWFAIFAANKTDAIKKPN